MSVLHLALERHASFAVILRFWAQNTVSKQNIFLEGAKGAVYLHRDALFICLDLASIRMFISHREKNGSVLSLFYLEVMKNDSVPCVWL